MHISELPLKTRFGVSFGHLYPLLSGCGSFANSKLMRFFDPVTTKDVTVSAGGGYAVVPPDDYVAVLQGSSTRYIREKLGLRQR